MLKYMKYELKGTYKFMLAIILTVLGASTGLQIYAKNLFMSESSIQPNAISVLFITIMGFLIFGAFITALFYIIGSFRKELYEDRGYLTFSLPLTGNQILGSKTLIALMWAALLILFSLLYNFVLAMVLHGGIVFDELIDSFRFLFSLGVNDIIITIFLAFIFSGISTLLLIYFSIALSRVTIRNKKVGGMWFIIFLILNSLLAYLTVVSVEVFPFYFDMSNFKIIAESDLAHYMGNNIGYIMSAGSNSGMVVSSTNGVILNIGSTLFSILMTIGIFLGTSYLIERKIDL
ncbi:hypothetical protein [Tissierella sp. Yu-01]|uniref:hypothetical protein n=1 Tax=Tissierella sp. Yu-01 TaxID=3035694 RepID=UPI00240D42B1|nr:hypothetical protein [Tissierella sp. Yu-01]WFA09071.1 hypothetical protein P3962_00445 [Tissierella sp. Yu-01]